MNDSTPQRGKTGPGTNDGSFAPKTQSAPAATLTSEGTGGRTDEAAIQACVDQAKATGQPVLIPESTLGVGTLWLDENGSGSNLNGDYSIGAEPTCAHTWATGNDEAPFITITEQTYVVARFEGGDNELSWDEMNEGHEDLAAWEKMSEDERQARLTDNDPPKKLLYGVEQTTEILIHRDATDPGGSEINSEYERQDGYPTFQHSLEDAERVARRLVKTDPDLYMMDAQQVAAILSKSGIR